MRQYKIKCMWSTPHMYHVEKIFLPFKIGIPGVYSCIIGGAKIIFTETADGMQYNHNSTSISKEKNFVELQKLKKFSEKELDIYAKIAKIISKEPSLSKAINRYLIPISRYGSYRYDNYAKKIALRQFKQNKNSSSQPVVKLPLP